MIRVIERDIDRHFDIFYTNNPKVPDNRDIFAKRRAIENIHSRLTEFPGLSFEYHCADSAKTFLAWRKLLETDSSLQTLEIDRQDIATDPELTSMMKIAD